MSDKIQDFFTLFIGLMVEATPFIVIGVIVSIIITFFFKQEWLYKIIPKNNILSHMMFSVTGMLMPVCECGNIPAVRGMILNGNKVSHAITFLLAAPVINPITITSTFIAFQGIASEMVFLRILGTFIIANIVGILLSLYKNQEELLTADFYKEVCHHDHAPKRNMKNIASFFSKEFITVFKMLIIGAVIASLVRVIIPEDMIFSIAKNPILGVIAMMIFGFVLSICANVDAFLIANYTRLFGVGSVLSFLLYGPMIDIKIILMLRETLSTKAIVSIVSLVTVMTMIFSLFVISVSK